MNGWNGRIGSQRFEFRSFMNTLSKSSEAAQRLKESRAKAQALKRDDELGHGSSQ